MQRYRPRLVILVCLLIALTSAIGSAAPELITVNFTTVEVTDVLQAVARLTGVSIGVTESVKGSVSVNVDKKPIEEVLGIVTGLVGADWRRISDGAYVVGTRLELQERFPKAPEVLIHPLQYVKAEDASKALELAFPSMKVQAAKDANAIVLMGSSEFLIEAGKFLRAIDTPAQNKSAISMTLNYASVKDVKTILSDTMPELTVGIEENLSVITITGPSVLVTMATELLENIDQPPAPRRYLPAYLSPDQIVSLVALQFPRVHVETKGDIVEITGMPSEVDKALAAVTAADVIPTVPEELINATVKLNNLGATDVMGGLSKGFPSVRFSTISQQGSDAIILSGPKTEVEELETLIRSLDKPLPQVHIEAELSEVQPKAMKELGIQWDFNTTGINEDPVPPDTETLVYREMTFGKFYRASLGALGTISALQRKGTAKLLANPSLVGQHGVESKILIGEKIPYEVSQIVQGALVRSIETEEIGIKLYITPLVADDGFVTLKAKIEVSSFVEYTPAGYPRVVTRETETTVRVRDGDVMVIGGLLREEEIKNYEKVPILGDIPILKAIFSRKTTEHNVQDLVIFLTPRVLHEGESPVVPLTHQPAAPSD